MLDAMFEVPESDIVCVKIDENVILGKKPVEFIRATPTPAATTTNESAEADKNVGENLDGEQQSKAKTYA